MQCGGWEGRTKKDGKMLEIGVMRPPAKECWRPQKQEEARNTFS